MNYMNINPSPAASRCSQPRLCPLSPAGLADVGSQTPFPPLPHPSYPVSRRDTGWGSPGAALASALVLITRPGWAKNRSNK